MNVYVRELGRELGRSGLKVDIFTRYRNCDHDCVLDLGDGLRLVHLGDGAVPDLSKYDLYDHMPEFAASVVNFQQSNSLRYDLIHSHYWLSGWVGQILKACWGAPHLVTFHTLARAKNLSGQLPEPELRLSTEHQVMKEADRILALTSAERSLLVESYGVEREKIAVIPGAVDLAVFHPTDRRQARENLGLPQDARVVLYVGRIESLKGIDVLLRALSLLRDSGLRCVVAGGNAGEDGELPRLMDQARELGVAQSLDLLGPVGHEDLPLWYSAADITVVPSRYESFGLVALESLACGTPVVASDVGGLPSIVEHMVNGLLVPRASPERLAHSMRLLLEDGTLRERLSAGAVDSARRFAWPVVLPQVLGLYRQLEKVPAPL